MSPGLVFLVFSCVAQSGVKWFSEPTFAPNRGEALVNQRFICVVFQKNEVLFEQGEQGAGNQPKFGVVVRLFGKCFFKRRFGGRFPFLDKTIVEVTKQ